MLWNYLCAIGRFDVVLLRICSPLQRNRDKDLYIVTTSETNITLKLEPSGNFSYFNLVKFKNQLSFCSNVLC